MSVKTKYLTLFLSLVAVVVWLAIYSYPEEKLKLIACDVGQGDAILAIYGNTQILVDGGKNNKVIDCLGRYLPFWDRKIEVIVLTHPQEDHYLGLIEVLKRYDNDYFIASSLDSSSQDYTVLKSLVNLSLSPKEGLKIGNSKIQLEIVFPTEEFLSNNLTKKEDIKDNMVLGSTTSKRDPNEFSVVSILSLGEFDALLTGDIAPEIIDEVIKTNKLKQVEYIKIPHHGSNNGLNRNLLEIINPKVAVISVGKNQWGHPHKEVLELLDEFKVKTLRTDKEGDIIVITDGKNWEIE